MSAASSPFRDNTEFLATVGGLGALLLERALQGGQPQPSPLVQAGGTEDALARLTRLHAGGGGGAGLDERIEAAWQHFEARAAASLAAERFIPWIHVASLFSLNRAEQTVLLAGVLPVLDARCGPLLASVAGGAGAGGTVDAGADGRLVACAAVGRLLGQPDPRPVLLQVLGELAPLRHWQMIEPGPGFDPLALGGTCRVAPSMAAYLLGQATPRPGLDGPLVDCPAVLTLDAVPAGDAPRQAMQRFIERCAQRGAAAASYLLLVQGPDESLLETLCAAAFAVLGLGCLRLDAQTLQRAAAGRRMDPAFAVRLRVLCRDALLSQQVLVLTDCPRLAEPDEHGLLQDVIAELLISQRYLVVVNGPQRRLAELAHHFRDHPVTPVTLTVPLPDTRLREQLWRECATRHCLPLGPETAARLAAQYPFTARHIDLAMKEAASRLLMAEPAPAAPEAVLFDAARDQSRGETLAVAREVRSGYRFSDIVLPPAPRQAMEEALYYVRQRHRVVEEWGFEDKGGNGRNVCVLFHGPSGTGKTMAASVIANELSLALYKIDLSSVLSKYIGETEKHLAELFDRAEAMNIVLFFDEAESLFSRRTEARDSHDRYANIQTGYLLQRIETYSGVVILSTNLLANIDKAFTRRFRFIIEFPFPGVQERLRLWQQVFPAGAPREGDIEFERLAEKAVISGGDIRNIALAAAFQAAAEGASISMRHVWQAIEREYTKLGKVFARSDFSWDDE